MIGKKAVNERPGNFTKKAKTGNDVEQTNIGEKIAKFGPARLEIFDKIRRTTT